VFFVYSTGKYEFFQKRLMFVVDFEYVQGGVTLEEENILERGPNMVFVLAVGATQD
jgi:hypothetical protein